MSRRFGTGFVGVVLAVVLAVTTAHPATAGVSASPASAPAVKADPAPEPGELTADDIARLGGPPAQPAELPAPEMPQGDFAPLLAEREEQEDPAIDAAPQPENVELSHEPVPTVDHAELAARTEKLPVAERDEFTTSYATPEGSFILRSSEEPLNMQDERGQWHEISTELVATESGWRVPMHPLSPEFSRSADDDQAVRVEVEGHVVTLALDEAAAIDGEARASRAPVSLGTQNLLQFDRVLPDTDLEFEVTTGGVKETLIVYRAPEGEASWTWRIDVGDLRPVLSEDDTVDLLDEDGRVVAYIPTPVAWDSSGIEGVRSDALMNPAVTLTHVEGSVWSYTIAIDDEWLNEKERAYPLYVDPTIQVGAVYRKSHKTGGAVFNNQAHIGNTRENNTNRYWHTYTYFHTGAGYKKFVGNAQIGVTYNGLGTTNTFWGDAYRSTGNCYNCRSIWLASFQLGTGTAWTTGTGIGAETVWFFNSNLSQPVFLLAGWEASVYSHKRVVNQYYLEYWNHPTLAQSAPANAATGQSLTPTLSVASTNSSPYAPSQVHSFAVSKNANMSAPVWESGWITQKQATVPEGRLEPGTTYYWQAKYQDGHHNWLGQSTLLTSAIRSFTTQQVPPTPPEATATPGNSSGLPETITTLTPTLEVDAVTDPDNFPVDAEVTYEFKIATGADGKSGAVFTSGMISADPDGRVRWTVPEGTLRDGNVYSWIVQPSDGLSKNTFPDWVKKIKVDLRLGATGPSPFDALGPVTVNLANGNANLTFSSPVVSTLGGPMGMAFTYNSQGSDTSTRGLTGAYYDGRDLAGNVPTTPAGYTFSGKTPLMVRTDSAISFDWGEGSPGPALSNDHFMAQWTGFIRVPHASSQWRFGVRHDDGVRLRVNGSTVLDKWANGPTGVEWSNNVAMTGDQVSIGLDYYDRTGGAYVELWAQDMASSDGPVIVPASWLSTERTTLREGWGTSTPIVGEATAWTKAVIEPQAIVLTDITGATHTHLRAATGGYTPPAGEYGIVSLDGLGRVVYTDEDGTVYQFAANGFVESATPVADAQKPASPLTIYNNDGTVKEIVDPLSKDGAAYHRKISFVYQNAAQTVCPVLPPNYYPARVGSLCKIEYPATEADPTPVTNLYYDGGQLWIIEDPGYEHTVFQYDLNGRLVTVQDSTSAEYALTHPMPPEYDPAWTTISYADERVSAVTLPSPDGGPTPRMQKDYAYNPVAGSSAVSIAGLANSTSTVTYDQVWRQTSATSPLGVSATQVWHPTKDLVLSTSSSVGLTSTTIYDPATDRVTDTYGPAPAACFQSSGHPVSDPVGTSGCGILPAHSATVYDGGLDGLQAAFYDNRTLSGKPGRVSFGIGGPDGAIDRNWGTASPGAGIGVDNWSLRLTGLVTFPEAGEYRFVTNSDDGARVWVGDTLLVDKWATGSAEMVGAAITVAAGETRRIRVEYREDTGSAMLQLKWRTPSAPSTSAVVPGSALRPDYGLVTETTVDDTVAPAITASFDYAHPWLGQATSSTVDPGGVAATTEVSFEEPGASGWLRRLSRTLPAATVSGAPPAAATTTAYYGDLETAPAGQSCVAAGTRQFGFAKSTTGPMPQTGTPVVTEFVYDAWGRIAGTRVSGDLDWSCTSYDARGRVFQQTLPEAAGTRTITIDYSVWDAVVDGIPGTKHTVTDSALAATTTGGAITSYTDLIGRVVSYEDVWGTVTEPEYDPVSGRVSSVTTTPDGGVGQVTEYEYDADGKVLVVAIDGVDYAEVSYDSLQRLEGVEYPGGAELTGLVRDAAQRTVGQTWELPASAAIVEELVRSQSGRVLEHQVTRGLDEYTSSYGYDGAGRLVSASIPGHELSYQFASSGGCGPNASAGLSGNRTGMVDVWTAPGDAAVTTTTEYCYDWADRLLSSTVTNPVTGAHDVADGLAPADIVYDVRGNTTKLGGSTFTYDVQGRHVSTTHADGTVVTNLRDASGRIVSRTTDPAGSDPAVTVRYLYAGATDSPWATVTDASVSVTFSLPGGASVTITGGGKQWSYPSLLGHTLTTGDGAGTVSGVGLYDPFGQRLDPVTFAIGTVVSDAQMDGQDRTGWHQEGLKTTDATGGVAITEMGARLYVAALGRFLQVDPVEDASENHYVWPTDPIGSHDLTGMIPGFQRDGGGSTGGARSGGRPASSGAATVGFDGAGGRISTGGAGLSAASRSTPTTRVLIQPPRQLQAKFKHADIFGIRGNNTPANRQRFGEAIQTHINAPSTRMIVGTYRRIPATHYVDPVTGINVIAIDGVFLTAWRLNPMQLKNVLERGSLGGG